MHRRVKLVTAVLVTIIAVFILTFALNLPSAIPIAVTCSAVAIVTVGWNSEKRRK